MPITSPLSSSPIKQEEFAQLDCLVMRHAFECQNQLGRLCDELIYQNDLAARLQAEGLPVQTEVPLTVTCRDFRKIYSVDLVVANAGIYELKTALRLIGEHEAQLLNYLLLHEASHGKLINFRPAQVESRFINTTLTHQERRQFEIQTRDWQERDQSDRTFRENLIAMLEDWGCWLDLALYTEALVHFAGGESQVVQLLPLVRDKVRLGNQHFQLLNTETAFRVTALTEGTEEYERHLRRLLSLTPLRTIQWINLARKRVQLVSLIK
jgi:GxxExxY protein